MKVVVQKITPKESVLFIYVGDEERKITITNIGNVASWNLDDSGIYTENKKDLDILINSIIKEMRGVPETSLDIIYEMGEMES